MINQLIMTIIDRISRIERKWCILTKISKEKRYNIRDAEIAARKLCIVPLDVLTYFKMFAVHQGKVHTTSGMCTYYGHINNKEEYVIECSPIVLGQLFMSRQTYTVYVGAL